MAIFYTGEKILDPGSVQAEGIPAHTHWTVLASPGGVQLV